MSRYQLKGVDRKSGKERTLTVEAETEADAVAQANGQRMMVARVTMADSAANPTALPEYHDPRLSELDPTTRELRELRLDMQRLHDALMRRSILREPVLAIVGGILIAAAAIGAFYFIVGLVLHSHGA